jgi:predicted P-loop ATPase
MMELSILQHAKDKVPRQVTLDAVVGQIRSDQWPAGYKPLIVVGAVVNGGLQKKNIRWLTGLCVAHIRGARQVCDDPHTMLSWNDHSGGMYVVYEYELNDSYSMEQQSRYYSRVQHFGMEYYAHLTGDEADHTLVGVTKPVPLCHDPDVYYNAEAMAFHSGDISGKPSEKPGGGNSKTAKPKDIKAWLNAHVKLRRNVVTGREEYSEYLGADTNDIWFDVWKPVDDIWLNTQWMEMSDEQTVEFKHLKRVVKSDFVPSFHPFRTYLDSLPKWNGTDDGIRALSMTVQVKSADGTYAFKEQDLFYRVLKKWLVGMVAGWLDEEEVNSSILVLLGCQGVGKTTWFSHLLPPELRRYFQIKVNASKMSNDDIIALSRSGLVCLEELDKMKSEENNKLKSVTTMRFSDVRQPYDVFAEHRKIIASYCGTGNNIQFLNDPSGNRRWLPFEVASITSPRDIPFDYEAIYSQAYGLYLQGYEYYFSDAENEFINERNRDRFSVSDVDAEMVEEYFRKPTEGNPGVFMTSFGAAEIVSSHNQHVKPTAIGRALSRLGFESGRQGNSRGYYVVIIPPDERKRRAVSLAVDAMIRRCKADDSSAQSETPNQPNQPDEPEIF